MEIVDLDHSNHQTGRRGPRAVTVKDNRMMKRLNICMGRLFWN